MKHKLDILFCYIIFGENAIRVKIYEIIFVSKLKLFK